MTNAERIHSPHGQELNSGIPEAFFLLSFFRMGEIKRKEILLRIESSLNDSGDKVPELEVFYDMRNCESPTDRLTRLQSGATVKSSRFLL